MVNSGQPQCPGYESERHSTTSLSQLPTYTRAPDTEEFMRAARRNTQRAEDAGFEHYFVGPRDLERHSKLPYFLRMHGSVLPKLIVALALIGGWAAMVTAISKYVVGLGVSSLLLTILGFLVGLSLSFINSTAYERYSDGRKAWSALNLQSRNLARMAWFHVKERESTGQDDLMAKITVINLLLAFAVALKHRLRFEPQVHYDDLNELVAHLDTFAKAAYDPEKKPIVKPISLWKKTGEFLGLPFAQSNPRKEMKRASKPLGNLPLEIIGYISSYFEAQADNGNITTPVVFAQVLGHISALVDVLTQCERVASTPLPEAYSIVISQITLIYVLTLPFQLYPSLGWITIPGTVAAAYIILGIALIGHEIENPFGNDVNDLPLDAYCKELAQELDMIMAKKAPELSTFVSSSHNKVLWPLSQSCEGVWRERSEEEIRGALRAKCVVGPRAKTPTGKKGENDHN